jgi:hypothetical protein
MSFMPLNVFTFLLSLSEGQEGEAYDPSNKMMLSLPPPPHNKVFLTSTNFHFHLLFSYN